MGIGARIAVGALTGSLLLSGALVAPAGAAEISPRAAAAKLPARAAFGLPSTGWLRTPPPAASCYLGTTCVGRVDQPPADKPSAGNGIDVVFAGRAKSPKDAKKRVKALAAATTAQLISQKRPRIKWRTSTVKGSMVWSGSVNYILDAGKAKPDHNYLQYVMAVTGSRIAMFVAIQGQPLPRKATPKRLSVPLLKLTRAKGRLPLLSGPVKPALL